MSKPVTLADQVYLAALSNAVVIHNRTELKQKILRAQRFVLDTNMSVFLADLCTAAFSNKPVRILRRLEEQMRLASRLPFQTTWIEYDSNSFNTRVDELRLSNKQLMNVPLPPNVTIQGWLLESNQDINSVHIFSPSPRKYGLGMTPLIYHWRTDNQILHVANSLRDKLFDPVAQSVGWPGYRSEQVDISYTPYGGFKEYDSAFITESEQIKRLNKILWDHAGILHIIWTFLSTLGDTPVLIREILSKGFIAPHGGGYRKYLNFRTITLNIPDKNIHNVARNIVAKVRRGMPLHKVRSHWHGHPKIMPRDSCKHVWEYADDLRICVLCEGIQWRVKEYEQGDATFGIIYHDYEVTH